MSSSEAPKGRVYPLPAPAQDDRFTFGLVIDVLAVLERHGFPATDSGADIVSLQQALFGFLYKLESGSDDE